MAAAAAALSKIHSPSPDRPHQHAVTAHGKHDDSALAHTSQVHTPPTTDEASHKDDDAASTSSLSDLGDVDIDVDLDMRLGMDVVDDEESNRQRFEEAARAGAEAAKLSEIKPHHYENGVPIFKPNMEEFRDFYKYVQGVNPYGMQCGIVKIEPPEEWKEQRKALDEHVKSIKIKNPITQEFHGAQGIYTQRNMERMRSYNLPQWKAICEQTENQPPARRGEKRLNADKLLGRGSARNRKSESVQPAEGSAKQRSGRTSKIKKEDNGDDDSVLAAPPTPTSPATKPGDEFKSEEGEGAIIKAAPSKTKRSRKAAPKPRSRQPKSTSRKEAGNKETTVAARRLRNAGTAADDIDEEAFKDFDYRYHDNEQFTAERCEELEEKYWKSLNFSNPMYAADMPGSLFDEDTKEWNVAKLPNLLDLLGQPIPGVNTAYLYLGMWRATFAWHLEDVDLYSINYIHFGAPKQWYSISQKDAPKFENAMKSLWGQDAKNCDQFLRHKTYLVSPSLLKSKYGVTVNKVVHREGEFVITFPIGYHSGYNLGYNCAESVNFATEDWLPYGKTARKCQCEADSVFIDVDWFIRRMNGEPSPEFEEVEVTDDEDDVDEANELMTPPASDHGKSRASRKRKRAQKDLGPNKKARKIVKVRKISKNQPCCLCPNDFPYEELLPTTQGLKAHRTCAMYTPETYIATQEGKEKVFNVENISKARLVLRCHECKQKKGACFQCSSAKCTRAYHATCAMQAGVQIDKGEIAVWHEGVEYRDIGFDRRCKLHRTVKRTRITSELSACNHANNWARNKEFVQHLGQLSPGELVQWQSTNSDEIEAGVIVHGYDHGTNSLLVSVLPELKNVKEIEPGWILFVDSSTSCLQKPSASALTLPEDLQGKTASLPDSSERKPSEGDPFTEDPKTEWAEFVSAAPPYNKWAKQVDLAQDKQVWHYLGKTSTESKAQYTADPKVPVHDPTSNFLDTVEPPKAAMAPPPQPRRQSLAATSYPMLNVAQKNAAVVNMKQQNTTPPVDVSRSATGIAHTWMNTSKEKMLEMQRAGQAAKPSQSRDVLAAAEARANEQARILQRQQVKAQQLDLQDQPGVPMPNIGVDQQAVSRQKQFQQQAALQSHNMNAAAPLHPLDKPMPMFQHFPSYQQATFPANFGVDNAVRPQNFPTGSDWMNIATTHAPVFSPVQSPVMPQMKIESPPLAQSPIVLSTAVTTNNSNNSNNNANAHLHHGHPGQFQRPRALTNPSNSSSKFVSPASTVNNSPRHSLSVRTDGTRPYQHQIPPRTPSEIERQRRISNPAYPFKSPEQIVAQKEEREKHGSQSSGSRPGSRPGSGYTTTALPSPGLHPVTFGPEPHQTPMFINPNATQISPPGSIIGHRSKSGSISGAIGPMGPPPQTMPSFRRSMSSGNMMLPMANIMGTMASQSYAFVGPLQNIPRPVAPPTFKQRTVLPDAPVAEGSALLLSSLQPRPISPGGIPLNDKALPTAYEVWNEKGGFWGRVAGHYTRKHERSPTLYKSPFGHASNVLMPTAVDATDGLAGRFYQSLNAEQRQKIDAIQTTRD